MSSPLGHCLIGLASAQSVLKQPRPALALTALLLFAALAPDLDFLPGILIGDPNRFHHGPSHSLVAALIFAGAAAWPACRYRLFDSHRLAFVTLSLVYTSHLVADMLTDDGAAPYGIPLLWPFSDAYVMSPLTIFMKIEHTGGSNLAVLDSIFSWGNLLAMGIELVVTLPILLWTWHRARA